MKKDRYVMFTGGKNNSGDHLIKHRAFSLLSWLKPDVELVDFDGWKALSDSQLDIINSSKACLLTGGPALHQKMYPSIYALRNDLSEIEVPMVTMGIGWHSANGSWQDTHNYPFTDSSLLLLNKINESGFYSSVRDYHTLNTLNSNGFNNFLMTGCPVLYSKDSIDSSYTIKKPFKNIGFSLGVSLKTSKAMFKQMQNVLLLIKEMFPDSKITVAFHHSPGTEYLSAHGANRGLHRALNAYKKWMDNNNFAHIDISGSSGKLIEFYSAQDFHVGYRVHAHIYMNSINKATILLNEDGRGKALESVIGGVTLDAYSTVDNSIFARALHKLSFGYENFSVPKHFMEDLAFKIKYETESGVKFAQPRNEINTHFEIMRKFIEQLP